MNTINVDSIENSTGARINILVDQGVDPVKKRKNKKYILAFLTFIALGVINGFMLIDYGPGIALKLDMESIDADGKLINPATQSLNRYSSVLRELDRIMSIEIDDQTNQISFVLGNEKSGEKLIIDKVNSSFLVPLLPYPLKKSLDSFDHANLMLGEYARNGVSLSYRDNNSLFGYFNATEELFGDRSQDEFKFESGKLTPNPTSKPLRFNVTNNCLKPSLWEFSASDSVGEMYHSWFRFPKKKYFSLIRRINDIEISDSALSNALDYRRDLTDVHLKLEKLRREGETLVSEKARIVASKSVGGYSSQDSRRKAQQKYFQVKRNGEAVEAKQFSDLLEGDIFSLRKFVAPGVYSATKTEKIPFMPHWSKVEIREVMPLTRYPGGRALTEEEKTNLSHVEIILYEKGEDRAIVIGNIPISLLVKQEDYVIPAFGVGTLMPLEFIERRYIRLKNGPVPHYAYQIEKKDDSWYLVNNHEEGIEQLFLRPFIQEESIYLKITLVSYERIVDLLELQIPIVGRLKDALIKSSNDYKPPLYRVYENKNVI